MTEDVLRELRKGKEHSPFHQSLLEHAKALIKMSRSKMSDHYDDWDLQHSVYRGERLPDEEDRTQAKKGKPIKMVVPNTFAQTMTFSSFLFLMFNQNRTFFELSPTGNEDYGQKQQDCELVLERDLRYNKWRTVLFQHLLDVSRFGVGFLECSWTRKLSRAYINPGPEVVQYQGANIEIRRDSAWQEFVKYEGNLVRPVSPYRFFPDLRHPLTDFQKGEFCACEEEYTIARLRELEAAGEVVGVDHIEPLPAGWHLASGPRGAVTRTSIGNAGEKPTAWLYGPSKSEGVALVTKIQIWIVPSKYKFGPKEERLGPEEFPVLYHLWYANDNRIIRCEPAGWWHNQFGWTQSQFTPDMHVTVNLGLADLIYRLQDVISWHINARITDVRRNMRGRLLVDPAGVDENSLNGEGDIFLRKNVSKSGVDRWCKQLDMRDVTSGHMVDADLLGKIMEVVTGVNGNAMGQYNSGRRSAAESRVVTAGAAGRMKMHGELIHDSGLAPLGQMMLSNSRQSLSHDHFIRLIGTPPEGDAEAMQDVEKRYAAFAGTPEEVVQGDDYFTFDSTLASEKGFMAQSLQELLVAIISSDPMAASRMTQGIDPVKLVEEIHYLRGSGNIKRFKYTPEEQEAIRQQQIAMEQAKQPGPKINVSLSGKLTSSQEADAASAAGVPGRPGDTKVQETSSSNGARK